MMDFMKHFASIVLIFVCFYSCGVRGGKDKSFQPDHKRMKYYSEYYFNPQKLDKTSYFSGSTMKTNFLIIPEHIVKSFYKSAEADNLFCCCLEGQMLEHDIDADGSMEIFIVALSGDLPSDVELKDFIPVYKQKGVEFYDRIIKLEGQKFILAGDKFQSGLQVFKDGKSIFYEKLEDYILYPDLSIINLDSSGKTKLLELSFMSNSSAYYTFRDEKLYLLDKNITRVFSTSYLADYSYVTESGYGSFDFKDIDADGILEVVVCEKDINPDPMLKEEAERYEYFFRIEILKFNGEEFEVLDEIVKSISKYEYHKVEPTQLCDRILKRYKI